MIPISNFPYSEEICSVTIGIEPEGHTHCGIIVNSEDGIFFIHLGSPLELSFDKEPFLNGTGFFNIRQRYKWAPFKQIHPSKLNLIKTKCIDISENNRELPYGIYLDKDTTFDVHGNFIKGTDSTGLTCASFVMILLKSVGLNIIDDNGWPEDRPSDLIWLKGMINSYKDQIDKYRKYLNTTQIELNRNKGNKDDLQRRKMELQRRIRTLNDTIYGLNQGIKNGFKRFRPEEVAGVCYRNKKEMPIRFIYDDILVEGAEKIGENLLEHLKTSS